MQNFLKDKRNREIILQHSVVSASQDGTVRVWNTKNGECLKVLNEPGQTTFRNAYFNHSGTQIAAICHTDETSLDINQSTIFINYSIIIWDISTGIRIHKLHKLNKAAFLSIDQNKKSTLIVSGCTDHTICIQDTISGDLKYTLTGHTGEVNSVAFSTDDTKIVSGSSEQEIRIWDLETKTSINVIKGLLRDAGSIKSVACSPDGKQIVSSSHDKDIRVWLWPGQERGLQFRKQRTLKWQHGRVLSVNFSRDGKQLVSAGGVNVIRIWRSSDWKCVKEIRLEKGIIHASFSPDGKKVAASINLKTVLIIDWVSGVVEQELNGHESGIATAQYNLKNQE